MIIMPFSLFLKLISQLPKANKSTKSNVVCPSHDYGKAIEKKYKKKLPIS
jgi:hypothetical protein